MHLREEPIFIGIILLGGFFSVLGLKYLSSLVVWYLMERFVSHSSCLNMRKNY